jgi:hypothetical protein
MRHHLDMRRAAAIVSFLLILVPKAYPQNWKKVHSADEAKWSKETGLDSITIHKLWRAASTVPDEKDDDSRIAYLDLEGLATRRDVLLVTYAGEKNCLTITVFRRFSETRFNKLWSVSQPPDGTGFCDNNSGTAAADAVDGVVEVRVPRSAGDGSAMYTVYAYEWNGITYRFAGQKEVVK